jgi:hypothetical protein
LLEHPIHSALESLLSKKTEEGMTSSHRIYHGASEEQHKVKAVGRWLGAWSVLGLDGDLVEMKWRRWVASDKAYVVDRGWRRPSTRVFDGWRLWWQHARSSLYGWKGHN